MLTLTVDAGKFANEAESKVFREHFDTHKSIGHACHCPTCSRLQSMSIQHVRKCWSKLRGYMLRRFGVAPSFVAVMEFQKVTGMAHMHIMIDRWIEQAWIKESWQALGGGQHVDIRHIDAHRAAVYVSKYLSKELFLNAPIGMRRVTTSGSIKLDEKEAAPFDWEVLKTPIDRLFVVFLQYAGDVVRSDGELESFSLLE